MAPLKAVVRNGRIVVDEPTDLPEGMEIELVPVDEELDPDERARLLAALDEGANDIEAGRWVDGDELIARLKAKHAAANR